MHVTDHEADEADTTETTEFSTKTQADQIADIFTYYGVNVSEWTVGQTANNVAVNRKCAELLGLIHIACSNHLLDSELEKMMEHSMDDDDGTGAVCSGRYKGHDEVLGAIKQELCAVMKQYTHLNPVFAGMTHWQSHGNMTSRFEAIADNLAAASKHKDAKINIHRHYNTFKANATNVNKILEDMNYCSRQLQTQGYTVAECREILDTLIRTASNGSNNISNQPLVWSRA